MTSPTERDTTERGAIERHVIEFGPIEFGPIAVCARPEAVARFASATRASRPKAIARASVHEVPVTFAMTWLARPDVRTAVLSLARPGEVAVHEEQTFDLHAPLSCDGAYEMRLRLERTHDPARVVIASDVASGGAPILAMRTVLRLFSATATAASPSLAAVEP